MSYECTVQSLAWRWDRPRCILWGDVTLTDGQKLSVGLPLAHVVAQFDACAAEHGLQMAPMVGSVCSVDGFFSSITHAVSSAAKGVANVAKKTVKATTKALSATVKATASVAKSVAKSKYLSYGLSALAVVVPAIGAPALAAQMAAKRALDVYDDAKKAKELIQNGIKTASVVARVVKGGNIMQSVQRLSTSTAPQSRLAIAALKSLPAAMKSLPATIPSRAA